MNEIRRKPTESELRILRVLWRQGPSSVRDVHEALRAEHEVGYTTVLKLLQIMAEKGSVTRDDSRRAHIYAAAEPADATKRRLAGDLVERVFEGSARDLLLHALGSSEPSAEELEAMRDLIDRFEKGETS